MTATAPTAIFGRELRGLTLAVMAAIGIVAYNNLAVSAALPEIGSDLGDVALLPWTISVELLTSGVAVLVAGPLVDGFGPRRIFRLSVVGFMVTSLICALAPTMATLIAARALQGVTAGLLLTVVLAAIGMSYQADARARVFASNSTVWGVTSVAGPSIAAVMVALANWRGVFWFNIPVALLAAALAWNRLPANPIEAQATAPDRRGIALVTLLSAAGLAVVEGSVLAVGVGIAVTAASLAAYLVHIRDHPHPVVRIEHVWSGRYGPIHLTSLLAVGGSLGFHAFVPVYLKAARGASTTEAAFSVAYLSVGWTLGAIASTHLQPRIGRERTVLAGSLVMAPGLIAAVVAVATRSPLVVFYALLFVSGLGIGSISTTGINILQERTPMSEMGRVNGAHQFMRTLGITYAVGIAGSLILTTVDRRTGNVEAVRDLLSGDTTTVDTSIAEALELGFQLALGFACLAGLACIPSAIALVRGSREQVTSAV